jgi:predicted glycoside hydrolase/deacetylase ChbG (UPF0249 family)
MTMSAILQICADDFGLSEGVNLAILDLIRRGRLSATSCMMGSGALATHAAELSHLRTAADIGLHLTFTDLAPLGAMPKLCPDGHPPTLNAIMQLAFTNRLDYSEIKAEIGRQIDRFTSIFGRAPDFVDGHQHVHLLPVIRGALLDHFRDGRLPRTTAVRNCAEPLWATIQRGIEVPKTLFISALSLGMAASAKTLSLPVNDSFRGVTAFVTDQPFGPTFRRFLTGPGLRPLAMCHPGLPGYVPDATDAIATARALEYAYFNSEDFIGDLARAGVTIGRHPR